ncbi:hypothetical protein KC878_01940 [Candidatus Saccharibacteria bacterium]|nr:hypothetical protein [Candidatus Saccharibacteria bacterium]MCB9821517.1 hypothetical protein [Candidatus Nomurabacteria bacterium]
MAKKFRLTLHSKRIVIVIDKILLLRAAKKLHGRFWGITGLLGIVIGFTACFLIEPSFLKLNSAFSDFSRDTRTAPYFAGSIFLGAYGLWRWRNYLARTFKKPGVIVSLISLTILGLYVVALLPLAWGNGRAYHLHMYGFSLVGLSMALTVFADTLLRKTKKSRNIRKWQVIRFFSLACILVGGVITALSTEINNILGLALVGESLILFGYGIWVITKTYQGEGPSSRLSQILNRVIVVE